MPDTQKQQTSGGGAGGFFSGLVSDVASNPITKYILGFVILYLIFTYVVPVVCKNNSGPICTGLKLGSWAFAHWTWFAITWIVLTSISFLARVGLPLLKKLYRAGKAVDAVEGKAEGTTFKEYAEKNLENANKELNDDVQGAARELAERTGNPVADNTEELEKQLNEDETEGAEPAVPDVPPPPV